MNSESSVIFITLRALFRIFLKISCRRMVMLTVAARMVAPADVFRKCDFAKTVNIQIERLTSTIRAPDFTTGEIFS